MHCIYKEDSPSSVVLSSAFNGSERILFELSKSCDIHMTSDLDIIEKFIEKSDFSNILTSILSSNIELSGDLKEVLEDLEYKTDKFSIDEYIKQCDVYDIFRASFFTPVPEVTEVRLSIVGETTVEHLRKISPDILDHLSVEIFTDFCKIQSNSLINQV